MGGKERRRQGSGELPGGGVQAGREGGGRQAGNLVGPDRQPSIGTPLMHEFRALGLKYNT